MSTNLKDSTVYAFELSGEHDTLPQSEVLALLDIYASQHREVCSLDQCLVVEAQDLDVMRMASRLALAHRIIQVLAISEASTSSVIEAAEGAPIPKARYSIRARRVKQSSFSSEEVERAVGEALWRRGYKADLRRPEIVLRAIITGGKVVFGLELAKIDRRSFEERRPHLKPFFHPGALMPRIARALVNLCQEKEEELLLDPFCGTGGILVEACLVGIKGIGVDVQEMLIRGAELNLMGLDHHLITGDARRLPFKDSSIDGAVADTPYGRSALIRADSKDELIAGSLLELRRVLKPGRRAVVVADRSIRNQLEDVDFKVVEEHTHRVHRSLTRYIFICGK
jgi:tRNA (guanine10-N2)-dimethyltransferase